MFHSVTIKQFDRDVKLAKKRGKNLEKLRIVMQHLLEGKKLQPKHLDHGLTGNYANRRECHIEPDWLLIYKPNMAIKEIVFERTGTLQIFLNKLRFIK